MALPSTHHLRRQHSLSYQTYVPLFLAPTRGVTLFTEPRVDWRRNDVTEKIRLETFKATLVSVDSIHSSDNHERVLFCSVYGGDGWANNVRYPVTALKCSYLRFRGI